jgi:hypothetical protein
MEKREIRTSSVGKTLEKLNLIVAPLEGCMEACLKKIICEITDFIQLIQDLCPVSAELY